MYSQSTVVSERTTDSGTNHFKANSFAQTNLEGIMQPYISAGYRMSVRAARTSEHILILALVLSLFSLDAWGQQDKVQGRGTINWLGAKS
jgi:hypothetical protein